MAVPLRVGVWVCVAVPLHVGVWVCVAAVTDAHCVCARLRARLAAEPGVSGPERPAPLDGGQPRGYLSPQEREAVCLRPLPHPAPPRPTRGELTG